MKAAFIHEPGPAEDLQYGDLPVPEAGRGQVLVRVGAVALNPVDTYIRSGAVEMELPRPFIVGCDLAGTVESVGANATRFKPGDRVWGTNQGLLGRQGTFAEFAAVDECWLYPTPEGVSDEDAAAISLVGITAHLGLVQEADLQSGETLLVQGGAGGVGSTVIQMAKALGARVIATAGNPTRLGACRKLGADEAIDYHTADLAREVRRVAPDGVDVWWEIRREPDFELAVDLLAERGRLVLMAGREARPPFPVGPFYLKGCRMHGFVMFGASADAQRRASVDINRWLAAGKLRPRIDRVLPLSEAATAHRLQEAATIDGSGDVSGKIVLVP